MLLSLGLLVEAFIGNIRRALTVALENFRFQELLFSSWTVSCVVSAFSVFTGAVSCVAWLYFLDATISLTFSAEGMRIFWRLLSFGLESPL